MEEVKMVNTRIGVDHFFLIFSKKRVVEKTVKLK